MLAASELDVLDTTRRLARVNTLMAFAFVLASVLTFALVIDALYRSLHASPQGITMKAKQPTTNRQPTDSSLLKVGWRSVVGCCAFLAIPREVPL
jgi:hypothetical protein